MSCEWTIDELLDFGRTVETAFHRACSPDAPLTPSDKGCRFCKAQATCPALRQEVLDLFDTHQPNEDLEFSDEALALLLPKLDMIERWVGIVRLYAQEKVESGGSIPGWKLVEGRRGARQWADEELAADVLFAMGIAEQDLWTKKLVSPAKAAKLVDKDTLASLVTQSEGKPTLVPESDKRPAIHPEGGLFAALPSETD